MPTYIEATISLHVDDAPEMFVAHVDGTESLGRPYSFVVDVLTDADVTFDPRSVIAERATLTFHRHPGEGPVTELRTISGVITEVVEGLSGGTEVKSYTLKIEPPVAVLAQIHGQEIFVGAPIPDVIVEKLTQGDIDLPHTMRVLAPAAYVDSTDTELWTDAPATGFPGEPRLVTQYKETDLSFLMRLAEHVGLAMFFEPGDEGDVAVFTDHNGGFTAAEDAIAFHGDGSGHGILSLRRRTRWVPTTVFVADYNYRAPTQTLRDTEGAMVFDVLGARSDLAQNWPGISVEFAPNVKNDKEAQLIAKVRAEELASSCDRYEGSGQVPAIAAGLKFKISGHATVPDTQELVAVEVKHTYTAPPALRINGGTETPQYSSTFEAVPVRTGNEAFTVRAQRRTPKPRIHGFVNGVVVAPDDGLSAQYQHLDGVGRYLVKMHFAQGDMPTMPRIRLAQAHAGPNYGIHFPLRPGTEVLIAFCDGDPDRPHILAAIPNAITQSPVVATSQEGAPIDPNRILTRSGILIELSDGDPPATS
ncbi:MAG: type VI secretion system tip protein VgrG [Polyangiaceae bacterium]|nr:type VI secretion system tip protein VgrG [Polyangiaceae bacterium]